MCIVKYWKYCSCIAACLQYKLEYNFINIIIISADEFAFLPAINWHMYAQSRFSVVQTL